MIQLMSGEMICLSLEYQPPSFSYQPPSLSYQPPSPSYQPPSFNSQGHDIRRVTIRRYCPAPIRVDLTIFPMLTIHSIARHPIPYLTPTSTKPTSHTVFPNQTPFPLLLVSEEPIFHTMPLELTSMEHQTFHKTLYSVIVTV